MGGYSKASNGKKVFLVNDDGQLDYTAKVKGSGEKVVLRRSKGEHWQTHCRGEFLGQLKDNGKGVKLKFGGKTLKLEYHEFVELYLLLQLKVENDQNLF